MKLQYRKAISLTEEAVARVIKLHNAKFLGPWSVKDTRGNWSTMAVDVFYVPSTKEYYGYYRDSWTDALMCCNAASFNSVPITGMLIDGVVYASRYRHDCVEVGEKMIDGGRDYLRTNCAANLITFNFVEGEICLTS